MNISAGSVISSTLGTSIETAELANNAVTSAKIADGTVATADLADNAVTSAKIADGTIVTADLANNAVTAVKIAPMGATNGQVLQYNGTAWAPATVASGATGWGLTGNAATANDFLGTTNAQGLRFKVNGEKSGSITDAGENTSFGYQSLKVLSTGVSNTGVGHSALLNNTTGGQNVALGHGALITNSSGSGNVGIGYAATVTTGTLTNAAAIGNRSVVGQSNSLVLGSINGLNGATVSANVGIGTPVPNAPLEIKSNSYINIPQLRLRENTAEFTRVHFQNTNTGAWVLAGKKATNAANSVFNVFYSEGVDGNGGSDILSLSGQGKVGINTSSTTTDATYGTLGIRSTIANVDNLTLLNSSAAGRWGFWVVSTGNPDLRVYQNGTLAGTFSSTSGAYTSVSDRRLKENIVPVINVLDRIKDVEVMHYTFKSDEGHRPQLGYIAQNLEEHFPEFVNKPDPNSERESFYTVNYAGMSAVAIKAIQEQQEMIISLQQAMAKMQERLDKLEK